jgi:heterogeneous nuclear ribonucleoprotein F/H
MRLSYIDTLLQGHADAVYQHVLRMNGLPWSTRNEDVRKFFKECSVVDDLDGIHICINKEGRPSGDAYVIFETEQVRKKRCKNHCKKRYSNRFTLQ